MSKFLELYVIMVIFVSGTKLLYKENPYITTIESKYQYPETKVFMNETNIVAFRLVDYKYKTIEIDFTKLDVWADRYTIRTVNGQKQTTVEHFELDKCKRENFAKTEF